MRASRVLGVTCNTTTTTNDLRCPSSIVVPPRARPAAPASCAGLRRPSPTCQRRPSSARRRQRLRLRRRQPRPWWSLCCTRQGAGRDAMPAQTKMCEWRHRYHNHAARAAQARFVLQQRGALAASAASSSIMHRIMSRGRCPNMARRAARGHAQLPGPLAVIVENDHDLARRYLRVAVRRGPRNCRRRSQPAARRAGAPPALQAPSRGRRGPWLRVACGIWKLVRGGKRCAVLGADDARSAQAAADAASVIGLSLRWVRSA